MSSSVMDQVKQALHAMYSASNETDKINASKFLEQFQKSEAAWEITHTILTSNDSLEVVLFAAQTLRSKVTYDLNQLPEHNYTQLRESLLQMLSSQSHKVVRTQLSIAVAQLALQDLAWHNTVADIIGALSQEQLLPFLLDVLRILPEELSDLAKTSLTDAEFNQRTSELITDNVERVLRVLADLAPNKSLSSLVLDCLNSWIKECRIEDILTVTPLTSLIFESLTNDDTFDRAVECLCTILRETRDIDNHELIDALYQQVLQLNAFMTSHPEKLEDPETFDGLVRLYVEAGESWHVLIAKNPGHFRELVEILLKCTAYNQDLDVVKYTFYFWYLLKLLLTLPRFKESKVAFADIYESLISVIIVHLTYPADADDSNLFQGDKEQEDKFKEFRYEMGDVLKDCCAVVGATRALNIPFQQLQNTISSSENAKWQQIEAPLFSMRTMAKEVSNKEKTILPVIMGFLVQLPEHPKIRYAATLVLGRYTEWTAKNPQYLEPQLNYIIAGFKGETTSDIKVAASHALMYFCQDCSSLLVNYLEQLYLLYGQIKDQIDLKSHYELADGLGHVILQVPEENRYQTCEMFWKPTVENLNRVLKEAQPGDEKANVLIADQVEIITTFISVLKAPGFDEPAFLVCTLFIKDVWPLASQLLQKFGGSLKVSERLTKLIKCAIQSFSTYLNPILAEIANLLHGGFQQNKFGCYLWVSGALVREYGDEYTTDDIKKAVYQFALTQCSSFFDIAGTYTNIKEIPDLIEDFFRMLNDILMYFPLELIPDFAFLNTTLTTSIHTMDQLEEFDPLISCLHFQIDFVSWGLPHPPISFMGDNPPHIQDSVKRFLMEDNRGARLLKAVMEGLIFRFHADLQQDASDLLLKILTVVPDHDLALGWLNQVVHQLPNVGEKEVQKLISIVSVALPNKDNRRVRTGLRDFVNWYARKNVTPRSIA